MKKNGKNAKTYSGDHVVAILEEIKDQFSAFGDGQKSLENKFDGLAVRFDKFDIRLNKVEENTLKTSFRLMSVDAELKGLKRDTKDNYGSIAEYLSRIEKELQEMKGEAKKLKARLREKANLEKLVVFERRLIKLEKLVLAKLAK